MEERDFRHLVGKTFEEVGFREASSSPRMGDGFIPLESTLDDVRELVASRGFEFYEVIRDQPRGLVQQTFWVRRSHGYQGSDIAVYVIEDRVWVTNYDFPHFNRVLVNRDGEGKAL